MPRDQQLLQEARAEFDASVARARQRLRPQRVRRNCPSCERMPLVDRTDSTCPLCGEPLPVLPGAIP